MYVIAHAEIAGTDICIVFARIDVIKAFMKSHIYITYTHTKVIAHIDIARIDMSSCVTQASMKIAHIYHIYTCTHRQAYTFITRL